MSDFSVYTAEQVADWMSQGTVATPPTDLYVAVFDGTGEVSGDFANNRVQVPTGTGWNINGTGFQNASSVDFGEAAVDVNGIVDIALYDDTLANGGNELARYAQADTPYDVSAGTNLIFQSGEINFDIEDRTEA